MCVCVLILSIWFLQSAQLTNLTAHGLLEKAQNCTDRAAKQQRALNSLLTILRGLLYRHSIKSRHLTAIATRAPLCFCFANFRSISKVQSVFQQLVNQCSVNFFCSFVDQYTIQSCTQLFALLHGPFLRYFGWNFQLHKQLLFCSIFHHHGAIDKEQGRLKCLLFFS